MIRRAICICLAVPLLLVLLFCYFMEWLAKVEAERDANGDISGFRKG